MSGGGGSSRKRTCGRTEARLNTSANVGPISSGWRNRRPALFVERMRLMSEQVNPVKIHLHSAFLVRPHSHVVDLLRDGSDEESGPDMPVIREGTPVTRSGSPLLFPKVAAPQDQK